METSSSRGPMTVIVAVVAAVVFGGIGYYVGHQGAGSSSSSPTASSAGSAAPAGNSTIVAKANGIPIYQSEVDALVSELGDQAKQIPPADLQARVVDRLIDLKLAYAKAQSEKVAQDPAVAERLRLGEISTVADAYLQRAAKDKVSDAVLKAKYDELVKQVKPVEEVRARHILVKTEAEAKDVIKQLDKGADFEKLAKEKSTDPGSTESGGDLGYFTKDKMVPEFADAAFKLDKGKYTETPVHSQYGWHVIQVLDKRDQPLPTLDQVKPQLTQLVMQDEERQVVADLRKDAKVERFNSDGTPAAAVPDVSAPPAASPPPPAPAPAPDASAPAKK